MFYDLIHTEVFVDGVKYKIKIAPMLLASYDEHRFTGAYALSVDRQEYRISNKNGAWKVTEGGSLSKAILDFAGREIEKYILNAEKK